MVLITPPEPAWFALLGFAIQTVCVFTFIIGRWWRGLDRGTNFTQGPTR